MARSRTVYEKTRFRRQNKLSFLSVAKQAIQARKSVDSLESRDHIRLFFSLRAFDYQRWQGPALEPAQNHCHPRLREFPGDR
jgi:hypothetical protein